MKNRRKEATRPDRGGGFVWTGAVDEHGIPVPLSNFDIERLTRAGIDAYRDRRQAQIEGRAQKARDDDDLARHVERYVRDGGERSKAEADFWERRNREAGEAAAREEAETLASSRRHVRQAL